MSKHSADLMEQGYKQAFEQFNEPGGGSGGYCEAESYQQTQAVTSAICARIESMVAEKPGAQRTLSALLDALNEPELIAEAHGFRHGFKAGAQFALGLARWLGEEG